MEFQNSTVAAVAAFVRAPWRETRMMDASRPTMPMTMRSSISVKPAAFFIPLFYHDAFQVLGKAHSDLIADRTTCFCQRMDGVQGGMIVADDGDRHTHSGVRHARNIDRRDIHAHAADDGAERTRCAL